MKKITTLFIFLFSVSSFFGQVPQKMSYQAVVRNAQNQLIQNNAVGMRLSVLAGSSTGPAVYVETHVPQTNGNGSVTIEIGAGTVVSGVFANIDWSTGLYWLQTEVDPQGANGYSITGVSQLLTVPYAFYSDYATNAGNGIESVTDNGDGTLTFTYINGTTYTTGVLGGLAGAQGPAGVDGINGTNGADGQNGVDGLSAYQIWINNGNTGTETDFLNSLQGAQGGTGNNGVDGQNGADGLSAYQIWLNNGNTGTEADFLNSLQGAQGIQGAAGTNGVDGVNGTNGAVGLSAYQIWLNNGNTGTETDFLNSLQGVQGIQGVAGSNGVSVINTQITNDSLFITLDNGQVLNAGSVVNNTTNNTHFIGEVFGGGIVIATWMINGVQHGLIVSPINISLSAPWSNITNTLAMAHALAYNPFDGEFNTNTIINQAGHTSSAASLCRAYDGGGFNDWYLPSSWELNMCYNSAYIVNQIVGVNDGFSFGFYWSSTEEGANVARAHDFYAGEEANVAEWKSNNLKVRAVRKF
jgi:hypothetical protein